jgi:hypothetical protein
VILTRVLQFQSLTFFYLGWGLVRMTFLPNFATGLYFINFLYNSRMHNLRPVVQMWSAEAFYLSRRAHNFTYLACIFLKGIFCMCKNMRVLVLEPNNKKFLARHGRMGLELCTLGLTICISKKFKKANFG